MLRRSQSLLDRNAGKLLLLGLVGVAAYNWRQWQRDKALLTERGDPPPRPPLEEWPVLPLVSVLVAAWDEADLIQRHIESFLALRYPHKELVLCAGGPDGTYELARQYAGPQVTVLHQQPGEGKQRALRRCVAQATGEIIFLTDADCLLNDEAFERTLEPIVDEQDSVTTGSSRPLVGQTINRFVAVQWAAQQYGSLRMPEESPGLLGRNCAVRSTVMESVGAFAPDAATGTDYTLARQLLSAGYTIRYVRDSAVETRYPTEWRSYYWQRSRWLRNLLRVGLRSGDLATAFQGLVAVVLGVALMVMPMTALALGPVVLAVWLVALLHGACSRVRYVLLLECVTGVPAAKLFLTSLLSLGLDLLVWASIPIQLALPASRRRWK